MPAAGHVSKPANVKRLQSPAAGLTPYVLQIPFTHLSVIVQTGPMYLDWMNVFLIEQETFARRYTQSSARQGTSRGQ